MSVLASSLVSARREALCVRPNASHQSEQRGWCSHAVHGTCLFAITCVAKSDFLVTHRRSVY
jgi:hypothetical protein